MPRKAKKCTCINCGNGWTKADWNKQMESLYCDHGYRFTQNIQIDLLYNVKNPKEAEGICKGCFKNYLRQGIEQHLD